MFHKNAYINVNENITLDRFVDILKQGDIKIKQLQVGDHAVLDGKLLKKSNLPPNVLIGPLVKGKNVILPNGNTKLEKGDLLVLFGKEEDITITKDQLKGISKKQRIKVFLKSLFKKKSKL